MTQNLPFLSRLGAGLLRGLEVGFAFGKFLAIPLKDIADSIKVALGIGNCALGSYCLVVTQVNHSIFPYMSNAQLPITNY